MIVELSYLAGMYFKYFIIRSIGSGAAVSLASKVNCRGLILMSPYTSI